MDNYEDFISTVSHELRTPLTSIRGFSQTMLASWDKLDDESKKKFLNIIVEQSNRLINLVENMLSVTKLHNTKENLILKEFSIKQPIETVASIVKNQYKDKTFEIIGVENDPNRKTQQNIIDFLNTKAFFGEIRPSVELKTINYLKHELDILIVKNTNDTPYYLADKYSDGKYTIRPNYIYTRIKDTNTPIDKSADINQVECL